MTTAMPTPATLRLLTFNVHALAPFSSTARAQAIGRAISARGYDVVCLQEVFDEDVRAVLVRELAPSFGHIIPKSGAVGWRDDSGLFFASKPALLSSAFKKFKLPLPTPGLDFLVKKGVLGARLHLEHEGAVWDLLVFDTHLDSFLASTRRKQLRRIRRFVRDAVSVLPQPKRTAVVLGGDMNVRGGEQEEEYGTMLERLGQPRDLYPEAGGADPGHTIPVDEPRRRLDYWFGFDSVEIGQHEVKLSSVEVVSAKVGPFDDPELSDHLPVEVVLRLQDPPATS